MRVLECANRRCQDINECATNSAASSTYCGTNAHCVNQVGWTSNTSFSCSCNSGFHNWAVYSGRKENNGQHWHWRCTDPLQDSYKDTIIGITLLTPLVFVINTSPQCTRGIKAKVSLVLWPFGGFRCLYKNFS